MEIIYHARGMFLCVWPPPLVCGLFNIPPVLRGPESWLRKSASQYLSILFLSCTHFHTVNLEFQSSPRGKSRRTWGEVITACFYFSTLCPIVVDLKSNVCMFQFMTLEFIRINLGNDVGKDSCWYVHVAKKNPINLNILYEV